MSLLARTLLRYSTTKIGEAIRTPEYMTTIDAGAIGGRRGIDLNAPNCCDLPSSTHWASDNIAQGKTYTICYPRNHAPKWCADN